MDAIIDCTSQVFEGLITLADPSKSWVAKWQRLDSYVRGVYATKVSGQLPDEIVAAIEDEGRIRYIPYDITSVVMKEGLTNLLLQTRWHRNGGGLTNLQ